MRAQLAGLVGVVTACASPPPPVAAPAPPAAPVRVELTQGEAKYRVVSRLRVEQEVGDQIQQTELDLAYLLTARLDSASDTLRATLVIDSVLEYAGNGALATDFGRAKGATFRGRLTADGQLATFAGGDSTVRFLGELRDGLRQFYPGLPAGGITPGQRWTDTTEVESLSSGVPLRIRSTTAHEVGPATDYGDVTALPVISRTTYGFDGKGRQGGQEFLVEGAGWRSTVEYLSLSGRYLGLTASDSSSFTISLNSAGLRIAGQQLRADTVSVLH